MIRRAEELEDMAQECRRLARGASPAWVREELLEAAERFERVAQHHRHPENQDTRSPKIRAPISAR
jgi:hypothetical protein